ncbi:MAG: hypothetical protein IJ311_04865 [Elusimicrobiaceae bacterium]|nr:hypothetical protein [Elusimicrobiaceae bacterium]
MNLKKYLLFVFLLFPVFTFAQEYDGVIFVNPEEPEESVEERRMQMQKDKERALVTAFFNQADQYRKTQTLKETRCAEKEMDKLRKSIKRKDEASLEAMDQLIMEHDRLLKVLMTNRPEEEFFPVAEAALADLYAAWKDLEKVNPSLAESVFQPLNHYYWIEYQNGNFLHRDGRPLSVLRMHIQDENLKEWISSFDGSF